MTVHIKSFVTTGVAIAGAAAIAVTPLSVAPQDQIIRATEVDSVNLLATPTPNQILGALLDAFEDSLPGGPLADAGDGATDAIRDFARALAQASGVLGGALEDSPEALQGFIDDLVSGNPLAFGYAARTGIDLFVALITPFFNAIEPNLPEAIASPLRDAFAQFGAAIAQLRDVLVPPTAPGAAAAAAAVDASDIQDLFSGFIEDFSTLSAAFGQAIATGATFFGNAPFTLPFLPGMLANPGGLTGLAQAVFENPLALGNAFSIVANSLLHTPEIVLGNPSTDPLEQTPGLLFTAGFPLLTALASVLPAPLGAASPTEPGLVVEGALLFAGLVNTFLGFLPEPAIPTPAAAVLTTAAVAPVETADVGDAVNAFGTIVDGFTRAGENFVTANLALGPGLLQIAQAAAAGNRAAVSFGVQQIIDAPLYIAKPLFEAFEAALPEPIGGQEDADPGLVWKTFVRALAVRDAFDDLADNIINPPSAETSTLAVQANRQTAGGSSDINGAVADTGSGTRTLVANDNAAGDTGTRTHRRSLVNVDVLNLGGARSRSEQASAAADDNGSTGTGAGKHRPGLGKDPVSKLVKRLTSGFDRHGHDDDDSGDSSSTGTDG